MIFLTVVWIVLFIGAGIVSILSYSTAKILADRVSMAGSAHRFTLDFFNQIQGQAYWIVIFLALIGIVFFLFRKKIEQFLLEKMPSALSPGSFINIPVLSRWEVLGLLILTGAGFSLRLIQMNGIVTYDEAFSYFQYAQNPWMAVTVYTHANNHIFHNLLLSIITSIFGNSYEVLRSIALVCGTLLIPMVFLAVRSTQTEYSAFKGWLAALIITINPLVVKYSALARGYTLQALIGVLSWAIFVQILQGRRNLFFILGLLSALALWTVPTSAYFVVGLGFAILGNVFRRRINLSDFFFFLIITGIVTFILWMPAVIVSGLKAVLINPDSNPVAAGVVVDHFFGRFKYVWEPLSLYLGTSVGFLIVILLTLWGLYVAPAGWRWIGLGVLTSIFLLTAFLQVTPPKRVWTFLVPLLAILVDFGVCKIFNFWQSIHKRLAFLVIVLPFAYIALVLPNTLKYDGPGHREVTTFAREVANQWTQGQAIKIEADKTTMLQSNPDDFYIFYDWNNVNTVRYYLNQQGIPNSAFLWRSKDSSPTVWLISVQVNGKPIDLQGPEGKKFHWDLIMGPYSLAKGVDKRQFLN